MRYYQVTEDGYITAIGTGAGGTEITEAEYRAIKNLIETKPTAPEGCGYRLTTALTREPYELPPTTPEPAAWTEEALSAMTNAELEALLSGYGISGSGMTKQTLVSVLLLAQGGDSG